MSLFQTQYRITYFNRFHVWRFAKFRPLFGCVRILSSGFFLSCTHSKYQMHFSLFFLMNKQRSIVLVYLRHWAHPGHTVEGRLVTLIRETSHISRHEPVPNPKPAGLYSNTIITLLKGRPLMAKRCPDWNMLEWSQVIITIYPVTSCLL